MGIAMPVGALRLLVSSLFAGPERTPRLSFRDRPPLHALVSRVNDGTAFARRTVELFHRDAR